MSGGDIAGLIAAGVFAVLVALLAIPAPPDEISFKGR
jgi:hypothetical protein